MDSDDDDDDDDDGDGDSGEGETERERGVSDTLALRTPPARDEAEADVLSVRWVRRTGGAGAGAGEAAREMSGLTTADGDSELAADRW